MKSINFILINGYGWSGSSAVVDLLKEYDTNYVPTKEFRLIKDPHGLIDLDRALTNPIDALNEDIAIREFCWFSNIYFNKPSKFKKVALGYSNDFGKDIKTITKKYLASIVTYEYKGYWWYLDMWFSNTKAFLLKVLRKLHIYNHREHTKMKLMINNEENFIKKTKSYLDEMFNFAINENITNVVLDQAIPANRSDLANRYFNSYKIIIVDRDPRDVYVDLIKEKSLVGYDVAINHDVELFVKWFKKVRTEYSTYDCKNVLKIRFEQLINDYDAVLEQVEHFLGLLPSSHIYKMAFLNPNNSKKNIGMWKEYPYQNEIRKIEEELSEYLPNFKKE